MMSGQRSIFIFFLLNENRYFTMKFRYNEGLCLLCDQRLTSMKEYSIKRHFERIHSEEMSKMSEMEKKDLYEMKFRAKQSMKSKMGLYLNQASLLTLASLKISYILLK